MLGQWGSNVAARASVNRRLARSELVSLINSDNPNNTNSFWSSCSGNVCSGVIHARRKVGESQYRADAHFGLYPPTKAKLLIDFLEGGAYMQIERKQQDGTATSQTLTRCVKSDALEGFGYSSAHLSGVNR
jgi:hypothetical protein